MFPLLREPDVRGAFEHGELNRVYHAHGLGVGLVVMNQPADPRRLGVESAWWGLHGVARNDIDEAVHQKRNRLADAPDNNGNPLVGGCNRCLSE